MWTEEQRKGLREAISAVADRIRDEEMPDYERMGHLIIATYDIGRKHEREEWYKKITESLDG